VTNGSESDPDTSASGTADAQIARPCDKTAAAIVRWLAWSGSGIVAGRRQLLAVFVDVHRDG